MAEAVEPSMLDDLQSPGRLAALDPHDMLGLVLKFPQQCREAAAIHWHYPPGHSDRRTVHQIVMTGLGGSAIGGDFLRCMLDEYGNVPLTVNRDYTLPHWVGSSTLVIAGSYSGNTEETLAAYAAAGAIGAQLAVVTSGGKIKEQADADGTPVAMVPGGQPPRSATGYMFFPMLKYIAARGFLNHPIEPDIEETLDHLEQQRNALGPDVPTAQNPAKQLALALHGRLPVIYGSQGYRGAVAYRWKCQFNENTKVAAFHNVLPEQNHNEILAWVLAGRQAPAWSVIFLRDPDEQTRTPRIARRVEVTRELISPPAEVHEVTAEGRSLLTRIFSLAYFADYVTVYQAFLEGICPTDIGSIDRLKAEMSRL
jgi:glucose/mannose-6-phosphate isomerase